MVYVLIKHLANSNSFVSIAGDMKKDDSLVKQVYKPAEWNFSLQQTEKIVFLRKLKNISPWVHFYNSISKLVYLRN